ncbi:hypothetical protein [Photobacterium swingsii]|uniref:hypothetical protein n=1 Tax=Photobacterium swingsii TaxID=680026 RepID=UPI0040683592
MISKVKSTLIYTAILTSLWGCNSETSDQVTYSESRIVGVEARIAPVMEVKSVGVNATAIHYQHSPRIDGYTVSVDELNDGGDSYQDYGYTLAEGDFEFPIVGAAKVSVQHDDSFDSSYLNGDVSRIYTYQAETVDIADTQMNFNIEFVNAGWMYVTAVFKESDIAQISEIKLVANSNEVEMVKSADSQHHYFYGYVRNDAELVLNYYGQELRSNIVYNTQQGTNEGKHGEFVVSTKEGNVIITDPDWDKLEPTPIVLPPIVYFTEEVIVKEERFCNTKGYESEASFYATKSVQASTDYHCRYSSPKAKGGRYSQSETLSDDYIIHPVAEPMKFTGVSNVDYKEASCAQFAGTKAATHYAFSYDSDFGSNYGCYYQSANGSTTEVQLIEKNLSYVVKEVPAPMLFKLVTTETLDLCMDVALINNGSHYSYRESSCYYQSENGTDNEYDLINAGFIIENTPYSLDWYEPYKHEVVIDELECHKETTRRGKFYYYYSQDSCFIETDTPEKNAEERVNETLRDDHSSHVADFSYIYEDKTGAEICSDIGESGPYQWNATSSQPQCNGKDISNDQWLSECTVKGGTAYFEVDFGKGEFSCIKAFDYSPLESKPYFGSVIVWNKNGAELCQAVGKGGSGTVLYLSEGEQTYCLSSATPDLSQPEHVDLRSLGDSKCHSDSGYGSMYNFSGRKEFEGEYSCSKEDDMMPPPFP